MKKQKKSKKPRAALPAGVQCFFITPTAQASIQLRRFVFSQKSACSGVHGYHNAHSGEVARAEVPDIIVVDQGFEHYPKDDPRWPTHCACGYEFQDSDEWQMSTQRVYVCDGKEHFLRDNTPGMMYDADWLHDRHGWCGPDGRSLHVVCPDGHPWCIDSRASNCTMKGDDVHRCWIRHGEPPLITVDKNGKTCAAGAGSIQTPGYHGFLRNGRFEP